MYGHLEEYTDVPLGIKGVVSVIYEPPQISSPLSVELIASQDEEDSVEQIARVLGLQKVGYPSLSLTSQCMLSLCVLQLGWIFTDLESQKNSKVAHKRHIVSVLRELSLVCGIIDNTNVCIMMERSCLV